MILKHHAVVRAAAGILALVMLLSPLPAGVALAATLTRSATSGVVGSDLVLTAPNGSFPPSSAGTISFAAGTPFAAAYPAASDNNGALYSQITVPAAPAGVYVVGVTIGAASGATTFGIRPSVALSTFQAYVGDQVGVKGAGFAGGATINIMFGGTIVFQVTSDVYGSVELVRFAVPASVGGQRGVTVTDGINSVYSVVTVLPSLFATPGSGRVGDNITLSGRGLTPFRPVTASFDTIVLSGVPASSAQGSFNFTFTVPATPNRVATISASDGATTVNFSFGLATGVSLSPTSGVVGAPISATGSGFGPGRSVRISVDGAEVATGQADANGGFRIDFAVPAAASGEHLLTASDDLYLATAAFSVSSRLSVNPKAGKVGSQVSATGTGFNRSVPVTLDFDGSPVAAATTDTAGGFNAAFAIPAGFGGIHTVSVGDGVNSANDKFSISPSIVVSPTRGPTATVVTIEGTGFKSQGTVTVRFDGQSVKSLPSDNVGAFTGGFQVPDVEIGDYTIVAADGVNTVTMGFAVSGAMRIDPAAGGVGSTIVLRGTGFQGAVSIKYDGETVGNALVGTDGAFSAAFKAPASRHGNHLISVTDGATTLEAPWEMESMAPPVPGALKVAGSAQSQRPAFVWSAVSDPSGVDYTLQVATDAGFTNIVLQKQALTTPRYQVPRSESLEMGGKDRFYYWRVKAVDLASNESVFSPASTFLVRPFPMWVIWVLGGIGITIGFLLIPGAGTRLFPRLRGKNREKAASEPVN